MPDTRPKHGANSNHIDPGSSVGYQHRKGYGEVIPEKRPYYAPRMRMADPSTKEWKEFGPSNPHREEQVKTT